MFSKHFENINRLRRELEKNFILKELDESQQLLDMKLTWNDKKRSVSLTHTNFNLKILGQKSMHNMKPVRSPTNQDADISIKGGPTDAEEATLYRSNIGSPLYLATKARPDLCLVASIFGSHVSESTTHCNEKSFAVP